MWFRIRLAFLPACFRDFDLQRAAACHVRSWLQPCHQGVLTVSIPTRTAQSICPPRTHWTAVNRAPWLSTVHTGAFCLPNASKQVFGIRSFPSSREQAILSPTLPYVMPVSSNAFAMDEMAVPLTSLFEEIDKPIPAMCADGTDMVVSCSVIWCSRCWRCTPLIFGRQLRQIATHNRQSACLSLDPIALSKRV